MEWAERSVKAVEKAYGDGIIDAEMALAALTEKRKVIEQKPMNRMPKNSFNIYTVKGRKKLREVDWVITRILGNERRIKEN